MDDFRGPVGGRSLGRRAGTPLKMQMLGTHLRSTHPLRTSPPKLGEQSGEAAGVWWGGGAGRGLGRGKRPAKERVSI